ncbi:hypothetical protein [Pyrinomonas sp.]|mgnify:CR=1 FL=1|uniref:hypothetical protein n=1 Tax=Pyrinomonas sp. TaxID=2080306 RepID=UPI0033235D82
MVQTKKGKNRRRKTTLLWVAVVAAIVIGLLWKGQIALLYVLATLSLTVLMLVVAFADLEGGRPSTESSLTEMNTTERRR